MSEPAPWYMVVGLTVGWVMTIASFASIVVIIAHGEWGICRKRYPLIPAFAILGITAWFWFPWVLYGIHCMPKPPMPPGVERVERP